ncbi:hypothetical protein [Litorisediminicola beolgyonensis]|uniref:Uncharacterized protein n=1 Tax=Litorisediminicola beolgyonensis TaxID=1173614 RepID=A0ABW3ZEA2_9RHOB
MIRGILRWSVRVVLRVTKTVIFWSVLAAFLLVWNIASFTLPWASAAMVSAANRLVSTASVVTRKDFADLKVQNLKLERDLNSLRKQKPSASKLRRVSNRGRTRLVRSIERSFVSIPSQSAPIVGAAVVVIVTALEIKDACDTLRDLDELDPGGGDGLASDATDACDWAYSWIENPDPVIENLPQCRDVHEQLLEDGSTEAAEAVDRVCECIRNYGKDCERELGK